MKKLYAVLLIFFLITGLVFAQAMGENLTNLIKEKNIDFSGFYFVPEVEDIPATVAEPVEVMEAVVAEEAVESVHNFSIQTLTASADKEAIPEGTVLDSESSGYITTTGSVVKRWASEKGVTSIEIGKALSGSLDFTVSGSAEVSITVSSTGKENDSPIGIIDSLGNSVANKEGIETVHGTSAQTLTYNLGAGSYRIVSPYDSAYNRGARVFTVVVVEKTTVLAVEPVVEESHNWEFRYFGVSVGADRNYLISAGEGIEEPVSLSSALFNADGSVSKKGGKFVADSPADGGSYYFTTIDPSKTNFYFQADVTIDAINPSLDGQEGFALMARDALGEQGVSGNWMSNLVSVTATKLPSPETSATIGFRGYTGIYTPEASDQNEIVSTRLGWFKDQDGNSRKVEAGKTYRVSLEKTDSAYIATQYDIQTNEIIGTYTYYIPAKDKDATAVKSYSELDDPLTYQEADAAYVALVVARGLNATFSNIKFTTSAWKAENWKPQPTTYVNLSANVISSETVAGENYTLVFRTNADGKANVYCEDSLVAENVEVKANTQCSVTFNISGAQNHIRVDFTPDADFVFSVYEKLSSYDTASFTWTVSKRDLGKDGIIYASPAGSSVNGGTSFSDSVDVVTAFNYAAPGQTVLLEGGVYNLADSAITVARGRNGSADKPITVTTEGNKFATLDFGGTGKGVKIWGNYWNISNVNITNTADGSHGMQLAGSYCTLDRVNFFNNRNSGLTVSGDSKDTKEFWPAYNTVMNCTSMNNADKALEDADGFCAKLTTGEGNVFDGCIAAYNADDGWDLFAKVSTGSIGSVTIRNSLTYRNGYLRVKDGSTAKSFKFADVYCDDNGNLTFGPSVLMEAGNGNGFKMGGSSMAGGHVIMNSIAYENKTKGIDSNSCPDIKVYNCTSYNNGSYNVALYTGSVSATTGFEASGVISFRDGEYKNLADNLALQNQNTSAVTGSTNYWWDTEKKQSVNTSGTAVEASWFESLDTSVDPERTADGKIDMHGLLLLNSQSRAQYATGARGFAWGQQEATVWVVGDSTVSAFNDKYFIPREGYGEEISSYFNATVYNLAHSGASSKDYTGMVDYSTLMNGSASVPALGDAETEKFLVIGFGHNDEKTEEARYTDPNGDYKTEGSFAHSLYVNYIVPALERGVTPVVCTPIARLTNANTYESYESASGHKTSDVVIGDKLFRGGDYAQAIRDMVSQLQNAGVNVELIDLTAASIKENVELGEVAKSLHSYTGAKYNEDKTALIPTGLDQTHTNVFGAKMNAYLISVLAKDTAPSFAKYALDKDKPSFEEFFASSINVDYKVIDYTSPSDEQISAVKWPVFTDASGTVWHGTVFGDVGGANKITDSNFQAVVDGDKITLTVANNSGKIASGSDGLMFYFVKLPVGKTFTLSAKARIESFAANNQVSYGLMVRDDLYIDQYVASTMGDYVAAGVRNQGAVVNFGRKSAALIGSAPVSAVDLSSGAETELRIVASNDGYTLTFGDETVSAGFDYALTGIDSDYIYAGFYVVRNCSVTFSDINLEIND